jgi:hypothetical protein
VRLVQLHTVLQPATLLAVLQRLLSEIIQHMYSLAEVLEQQPLTCMSQ